MSPNSPNRVNPQILHERRRAARALMMSPLIRRTPATAETFSLIRTHSEWLRDWFGRVLGWPLRVDSELARLGKTPAEEMDATRPARDTSQRIAFTRTRYVLFCLALACLERCERQTTLGKIATELQQLIREDTGFAQAGITLDLKLRESRKDLVHVMLFLLNIGVITRLHGDENQYISSDEGDALYNVYQPALASILNVKRGPSLIQSSSLEGRIAALIVETLPETESSWNRHLRLQLTRKLIDNPVLYYAELEESEKAYLDGQRHSILKNIEEGTGLIAEIRKEGIALVDEDGDFTDLDLLAEGTEGHFTLLLAEFFSDHLSRYPDIPVERDVIEDHAKNLIASYSHHWRKDSRNAAAVQPLLTFALGKLEALRLAHVLPDHSVRPLPAISRYSLKTEPTLFEGNV